MPEFKLFGGICHGRIVQIDNPFMIETWMIPNAREGVRRLTYEVYSRREYDGIMFYAHSSLDDAAATRLLLKSP